MTLFVFFLYFSQKICIMSTMKKVLLLLIITILLAGIFVFLFIRLGGGKYLKKAAKETYELGENVERLQDKMENKEEDVKNKLDIKTDDVKDKEVKKDE